MNNIQATIARNISLYCKPYRNNQQYQDARTFLPYCIVETTRGWLVLNRNYKPLGIFTDEHVDYDAPEFDGMRIRADKIDTNHAYSAVRDFKVLFLFDGSCPPWGRAIDRRRYIERAVLMFKLP